MNLPILEASEKILKSVIDNQVTIVVGETGSGKTTQIPILLYQAGFAEKGIIGITEPRRIAAISVSEYVAEQMRVEVGSLVGYQIRFDASVEEETKIKFMTGGILLREMQGDPLLQKYSVIMVDEAHERSQEIDFILGLLKDLLKKREDLRVIVASATINEKKFSSYFWDAPVINVSGRMYPVEVVWSEEDISESAMEEAIADKIFQIHSGTNLNDGDILVFVTGEDTIIKVMDCFEKNYPTRELVLLPAFGSQPPSQQKMIFGTYPGKRKVIIATNVAETSITIDGITHVIDSGLIKEMGFDAETSFHSLEVTLHSQAGCNQRMGRAGRVTAGTCHRMYTQESFQKRPRFTEPEILRSSLANVVLTMESLGIKNIFDFDFIDPPDRQSFHEAYETLIALGAIRNEKSGLTEIGRAMASLPLEPHIARMLLEAEKYGCVERVATAAALLSVRSVFFRPRERDKQREADGRHSLFTNPSSDVITLLNVWDQFERNSFDPRWCFENFLNAKSLNEAGKVRLQILGILDRFGIEISLGTGQKEVKKAVATGLAFNLFEAAGRNTYQPVTKVVSYWDTFVFPGSSVFHLRPRFFVASHVVKTTKPYARNCTAVDPEWLPDIVPHLSSLGKINLVDYKPGDKFVQAKREILFRDNVICFRKLEISLETAQDIQNALIACAKTSGLLKLTFERERGEFGNFVAMHNSVPCRASSFSQLEIEEGAEYYCKREDWLGIRVVTPIFRVFPFFTITQETSPQESMRDSLEGLAGKWGGSFKKMAR